MTFSSSVAMSGMLALPEDCIAAVISFTTPRDACCLACVSTTFRSTADSDVVWDRFLPSEYLSAISDPGSVSSFSSSSTGSTALSKKQLYLRVCHNLIHKGKMSFWFDLPNGKNCYMISARELYFDDDDWDWFSIPEAKHRFWIPDCRFPEVVMRPQSCEFEIGGKITTSLLSPMTTYVAYLVFAGNLIWDEDDAPAKVAVGLAENNNGQNRTVYFHQVHREGDDDGFYPKKRADGWVESELGEFFNGGDKESEVLITIKTREKKMLLIQGIEIRPKKDNRKEGTKNWKEKASRFLLNLFC